MRGGGAGDAGLADGPARRRGGGGGGGALILPLVGTLLGLALGLLPPSAALRAQGDPVVVDILVRKASRLCGADLTLSYDPAQLSPVDAMPSTPGIQAEPGPAWGPGALTIFNEADTAAGERRLVIVLPAPYRPLAGDLVLATLTFLPRRLPLERAYGLKAAELRDQGGQRIELRWEGVVIDPLVDWEALRVGAWLPRVGVELR